MKKIAQFEKVGYEQFEKDMQKVWYNSLDSIAVSMMYDDITLPVRKTVGSAGYDFVIPFNISIKPKDSFLIPTGIRCRIDEGWVMLIFPRSSLGIKKRIFISNTTPVIDCDYYSSDNEGHIFIQIENHGNKLLKLENGESFVQAVFLPFGTVMEETVKTKRVGGIGSTNE